MGKLLLFLSFLSLGILAVGTALFPGSSAFWLASHSVGYECARVVLMLVMFLQLVTRPPRHAIFRILAGFVATSILAWTWTATYNYQMQILDMLALTAAAIAVGVTALERKVVMYRTPVEIV